MYVQNFNEWLAKIETIIDSWSHRNLCWQGHNNKYLDSNSNVVFMLSYGNPEWALNKYNNLVNNFLWDEKPSKYMYGKPDFARGV
jgi:hypothetical protein